MRPLLAWFCLAAPALAAQSPAAARDSAIHAVNRLANGPAPGLIDSVARTGVLRWVNAQLAHRAPGDPDLGWMEDQFPVLTASSEDLVRRFAEVRREQLMSRRGDSMPPRRASPEVRELRESLAGLPQATLVRAVLSDNQLGEVMAEFWFNHFNVYMNKGLDRVYTASYVEKTIRPNALGSFRDLLLAVATSPAMLFYLDNVQSVAPGSEPPGLAKYERAMKSPRARRVDPARQERLDSMMGQLEARRPRGLNENYARELLELHTLGVEGGYSQKDVTEVARILTGWGIAPPRDGGGFRFHQWAHDRGAKTFMGVEFPAGHGRDEGERLLAQLAASPATMHHVSSKLCARFVSDVPPDGCIDTAVAAWKRHDGDIREILRAIVASPDFWAPSIRQAKVKSPFEFLVSAVRAVGGEPDSTPGLARQLQQLGQPLFLQSVPTGYPETQEDWVNSGALLARMNVAVALAAGRLPGVRIDLDRVVPLAATSRELVARVDSAILGGRMTDRTRQVILEQLAEVPDPLSARALAIGLALGGPEFQRQ
jgi:uncharacterized protein (DUF1800 family)